jgi:hypothetical protein
VVAIFRLVIDVNGRYAYECCPFELSLGLLNLYIISYSRGQILNAWISYISERMKYLLF